MVQKQYEEILAYHASWIVVNSVQGCPFSCAYCFLKPLGLNKTKPEVLCAPKKAIQNLLKKPLYDTQTPICLLTSTDPFANTTVIKHLEGLLEELVLQNIPNTICLVTKKEIPDHMIKKLSQIKNIVVYLSYSGLNETFEKGITHSHILINFKKLYNANIKCIHYWRPILPQNSDIKTLESVLKNVMPYSKASVIAGLKVCDNMLPFINFWPEAIKHFKLYPQAECFWPKEALKNIKIIAKKHNYPVLPNNICALSIINSDPNKMGFYCSSCSKIGYCTQMQKDICHSYSAKMDYSNQNISKQLEKLKINMQYKYAPRTKTITFIGKDKIPAITVAKIRRKTNCSVEVTTQKDTKFNSSITNSKPVEI